MALGVRPSHLRAIISHPLALSHCSLSLARLGPLRLLPHHDTAGALPLLRSLPHTAAIASPAPALTPTLLLRRPLPSPLISRLTISHLIPALSCCVHTNSKNPADGSSDLPPTGVLFPGCDYEHWAIFMEKPGGEGATIQEMLDSYTTTLAQVVGSVEEAKMKIYKASFDRYFGFGCAIDEDTSKRLIGLPGVMYVLPDMYIVVKNKDYGGILVENGEIVQRTQESQDDLDVCLKSSHDSWTS